MIYNKQPIDISTQLVFLKERGLVIKDECLALKQLASISYFRLANYWRTFEIDETTHLFASGTQFSDIIDLYNFDKELRCIIFTAIQDIEIALCTRIIHYFSMAHGAFWFMDASLFNSQSIYRMCLDNIQTELKRSKEDFLQEHFVKYDSPSMPPVWKTLEIVSFGTLSKLYQNIKDVEVKKQVAKSVGLPQYIYLESWMRSLAVLRNYCAHHARTWNRRSPAMPRLPKRLPLAWVDIGQIRPMKLYAQLCTLLYLEQSITPNSQIKQRLLNLFSDYSNVSYKQMGFPQEWRSHPIWQL